MEVFEEEKRDTKNTEIEDKTKLADNENQTKIAENDNKTQNLTVKNISEYSNKAAVATEMTINKTINNKVEKIYNENIDTFVKTKAKNNGFIPTNWKGKATTFPYPPPCHGEQGYYSPHTQFPVYPTHAHSMEYPMTHAPGIGCAPYPYDGAMASPFGMFPPPLPPLPPLQPPPPASPMMMYSPTVIYMGQQGPTLSYEGRNNGRSHPYKRTAKPRKYRPPAIIVNKESLRDNIPYQSSKKFYHGTSQPDIEEGKKSATEHDEHVKRPTESGERQKEIDIHQTDRNCERPRVGENKKEEIKDVEKDRLYQGYREVDRTKELDKDGQRHVEDRQAERDSTENKEGRIDKTFPGDKTEKDGCPKRGVQERDQPIGHSS